MRRVAREDGHRTADQAGGRNGSEIAAVEAVGRSVEQEQFVGPEDAAAAPDRQRSAMAVGRARDRDGAPVDRYRRTAAADQRARMRGDMLEQRDADGSEEHTSELQSLMRISYAVFCLKKQKQKTNHNM